MMRNLTTLPESFLAKEKNALVHFAQELKQYCHEEVNVLSDVDITSDMITVDAIVDFNGMIVAVIECVENEDYLQVKRREIAKIMKRAQVQLGIVITGSGQYYLRKASTTRSSKAKISTIASEIQNIYKNIQEHLDPDEVKETLITLFNKAPKFAQKDFIRPLFERACDDLDINRGRVSFKAEIEDKIMLTLLGGELPEGSFVCRYTTLDSLFKMIDGTKHAMCSPVSMNDKHECDYADSFMPWHVNRSRGEVEIEADNSYFLLSCSDINESDDLTMWRLYGDNAKGVCIEYAVDADKLDNDRYILGRVSYGKRNKGGKVDHPELSFLSFMLSQPISSGWYFTLSKWYIWKFFFKSWTYRDENEIRLIYIPDISNNDEYDRIKWYKDQSNGIFNRLVLIPIALQDREDFPLNLSKIILGPQSPEVGRNREQIWYMAQQKGIDTTISFSVEPSGIRNYR